MNIYLVEQSDNNGYDTYDSFVCVAKSEGNARNIHPGCEDIEDKDDNLKNWESEYFYPSEFSTNKITGEPTQARTGTWALSPDYVEVTLIGKAEPSIKKEEFICKSFNAG